MTTSIRAGLAVLVLVAVGPRATAADPPAWDKDAKQTFDSQLASKLNEAKAAKESNRWNLRVLQIGGAVLGFVGSAIGLFAAAGPNVSPGAWLQKRRGLLMTVASLFSLAAGSASGLISLTEVAALLAKNTAQIARLEALQAQVTLGTITQAEASLTFTQITNDQG